MNEQFIKNIRVLKAAISERKLVIFAGAGVSMDSGAPLWGELINNLRREINIPDNETDVLRIAQMYYNERQQKEFIDKIREEFKYKKLRYNEIHQTILELNPEHIVTTNFDDFFEQVIKTKAYPYSVIKKDQEFPYAHNTKLLVKIHGDLEEANLVIKEDDYLDYSHSHALIESFIKGVFSNKVVLFVGYSFSDIDLQIILKSVRNVLGVDFQNAYMLSTEKDFHPAKKQYLKGKGINVINYDDAGLVHGSNYIEQYLFIGRNALNYQFGKKNTVLSEQGSKLLSLLAFINKYSEFAESIVQDSPVLQMYKSLDRFNEVQVLPPKFLSNLYPFNNSKRYLHNYYRNTLSSNNKKITDFFFEDFNIEDQTINESFFEKHHISANQKIELNKKLVVILNKFAFSSIYFFGKSKSKIPLFEHPEEMEEKIKLSLPVSHCECLNCLYNSFQIGNFLKTLKEKSITETSEINNDLLIAYSNYKAGNFKTSFNQFEEIANKAWQLGKYISYYIAKQNIKDLRNMITHAEEESSESNKRIIEKIDDLDLDKLLFEIPNLNNDEYEFLKIIRDDKILYDVEGKINEYYDKTVDVFNYYKEGGFRTGPYYPRLILEQLYLLFSFYTYNYIVKDEYSNFTRVFEKGINAFLICYSIDDRYPERLKSFDAWMIKFLILYGDDTEIKKTIENYELKTILIDESQVSTVFDFLNNLQKSIITETNFLGRSISLDGNISTQSNNFFFQSRLRKKIHNTFFIFAGISIPEEYRNSLIRNFLDFLKVENILVFASLDYLNRFLINIKDFFSFRDFIELLNIASEKDIYYIRDYFFEIVGFGMKNKYDGDLIEDEELIDKIINHSLNVKERRHHLGFIYLWKVCSDNNKKKIEMALRKELATNFYSISYLNACFEEIIAPSEFYAEYINRLESHMPKEIKWENGKVVHESFEFFNFINLIYHKGLFDKNIPYNNFENYPEHWKFLLMPQTYNYQNFDPMWLLVVINIEKVHETLKDISEIRKALVEYLQKDFNEELSKLYVKFYL